MIMLIYCEEMTDAVMEGLFFQVMLSNDLWDEFKSLMFQNKRKSCFDSYRLADCAASNGYINLLREKHNLEYTLRTLSFAVIKNKFDTVKYLIESCDKIKIQHLFRALETSLNVENTIISNYLMEKTQNISESENVFITELKNLKYSNCKLIYPKNI